MQSSISNLAQRIFDSEMKVPNLRPEVQKQIVWANRVGEQSKISIVYVHGFSATSQELRPFPDEIASALNANLFFTRLTGHGQDSAAMGKASLEDWNADIDEALDFGRALGENVVVIACSTGAPLVLSSLAKKSCNLAACIFVSPNFGLANRFQNWFLKLPKVRSWGPFVMGRHRSFESRSSDHKKYWTQSYGIEAIFTMMEAVQEMTKLQISAFNFPLAILYCPNDQVVSPQKIRSIFRRWGGSKDALSMDKGDDPSGHLLIGDIMNPKQTKIATRFALDFCFKHLRPE